MTKENFIRLAEKVNTGTATDAEFTLYNEYFNRFQTLRNWDESILGNEQERADKIYRVIAQQTSTEKVPLRRLDFGWLRVAAVLFLFAGAAFWYINKNDVQTQEVLIAKSNKATTTNDLIELPDGSTVILSAGSKLSYAQSFDGKAKREVFLTGKAFFDIKHLEKQPFIVHTGEVYTQVLGTAFDVDSRNAEVRVIVIRGKVVVNKGTKNLGTLTPNRQVVYNEVSDQAVLTDINAENVMSWREKDLIFSDVTLRLASSLLESRYDVKVNISDEKLAQQHFTTTLFENQSLTECLALICDFNNAVYTYNKINKQVTIKPKN